MLGNLNPALVPPAVRERRLKGYQNALRFHRMYVQAGGRVLAAAMPENRQSLGRHWQHELEVFCGSGIHTHADHTIGDQWPAETLKVQDKAGTVAEGKLADLIIV